MRGRSLDAATVCLLCWTWSHDDRAGATDSVLPVHSGHRQSLALRICGGAAVVQTFRKDLFQGDESGAGQSGGCGKGDGKYFE